MALLDMVLALGMPVITIILVIMAVLLKPVKENKKLMSGLIISLGLFNLAMILDHTGMIAQPFLMWTHLVLPIGTLLIYLGLKE
jgi:galactitol-specific phosphotransferase system IIC component